MTSRPEISASMMNPREGRVASSFIAGVSFELTAAAAPCGSGLLELHLPTHRALGGGFHGLRHDEDALGAELLVREQGVAHGVRALLRSEEHTSELQSP